MGKFFERIDWLVLLLISVISALGVFVLMTLDSGQAAEQTGYFLLGMVCLFLITRLDRLILRLLPPYLFPLAIIGLIGVYAFPQVRGSHRWVFFFGQQLQPSELFKPFIMLFIAWLVTVLSPRIIRNLPIHLLAFLIPFLLIFRQPDLGTAIIYFLFWTAMMLAGGLDLRLFLSGILSLILIIPWAWDHLASYQQTRIIAFINPAIDPRGAGYNALQATIAVGSGQLTGRGLGFGTQSHLRFLPEHQTDFIFASLVEEVGFVGGLLLLALYFLLLLRILIRTWSLSSDPFAFTYGIGLFMLILSQVFINVGMNIGLLPITGITLPFVSYGGSSLISLLLAFGFFWSIQSGMRADSAVEIV
jgi:rod shape determining protein RodA